MKTDYEKLTEPQRRLLDELRDEDFILHDYSCKKRYEWTINGVSQRRVHHGTARVLIEKGFLVADKSRKTFKREVWVKAQREMDI